MAWTGSNRFIALWCVTDTWYMFYIVISLMKGMWICMTATSTRQSNIYQVLSLHLQLCAHIAIPHSVSELLMKLYTIYHTNGLNLCVDILGSLLEKVLAFKCHSNPLHSSPPLPCMLQGPNICTTANSHVVWPGNNPHGLFNLSPSSFFLSPRHPDDPCDSSPCRVHCSAVWVAPSCSLSPQVRIISSSILQLLIMRNWNGEIFSTLQGNMWTWRWGCDSSVSCYMGIVRAVQSS